MNVPLSVIMPYQLNEGENPNAVSVWYLDDNGSKVKVPGVYDVNTGMLTFTIDYQKYYMVGYDSTVILN